MQTLALTYETSKIEKLILPSRSSLPLLTVTVDVPSPGRVTSNVYVVVVTGTRLETLAPPETVTSVPSKLMTGSDTQQLLRIQGERAIWDWWWL